MSKWTEPYPFWQTSVRGRVHDLYAHVRQTDPVHRAIGPVSGNPFWFITRYEDAVAVLKHPRIGKDARANLEPEHYEPYYGADGGEDNPFEAIDHHLLNLDPPDHTRLRALVQRAFTPRMVQNLVPRIQQVADTLLDNMAHQDDGPLDLLAHYAFPLPITVIAEMLGVPAADQDQFKAWSTTLLFGGDQQAAGIAAMQFTQYIQEMIDARQEAPQDDLISALVQAEEDGDRLNRMELVSMIFLLLVAGHETTVNLIGNGTLALLQHPDQRALLVERLDDDDLLRAAVEEMLRYNGPVETTTLRFAFEDVPLGETTLPRGAAVLVALLAANRDPQVFDAPDRFDIQRTPNRHIAFGSGIHYCVGAPLARLEGQIAIRSLLARYPALTLATTPDALEWNPSLLLHGMKAMPVTLR